MAARMPVDWVLLDSICGGDRQAAEQMLREFLVVMPGDRAAIEKVLADGDLPAVAGTEKKRGQTTFSVPATGS